MFVNESLFFLHIFVILSFLFFSLRLGERAVTTFFILSSLFANLFVTKQIALFHMDVTASDAYAVSSILSLNLLQEHFGKKSAQRAMWLSLYFLLYFVSVSQLHLFYLPSPHDQTQSAFHAILSLSPRLVFSSMGVALFVQRWDILLFSTMKRRFPTLSLPLRLSISFLCSQCLDTLLFSFFGLYGLVKSLLDIIIVSLLIKVVIFFCMTPSLMVSKWFLPKEER